MKQWLIGAAIVLGFAGPAAVYAGEPGDSQRLERAKDFIADEQWERAIEQLKAAAADSKCSTNARRSSIGMGTLQWRRGLYTLRSAVQFGSGVSVQGSRFRVQGRVQRFTVRFRGSRWDG